MIFTRRLPFSLFAAVSLAAAVHADGPEKVLIIGDSMMRIPAHAIKLELKGKEGVAAKDHTSLGSGLARLDAYDWMGKIDELLKEFQPDAAVVWFGTNDRQPMKTDVQV